MTCHAWNLRWAGRLSELGLALLALLAAAAALVAAPNRAQVPAVGPGAEGALRRPAPLAVPRSATWVTVALALLLSVSTAGALAVTVLGGLGGTGCLAAATGVLMAAASARWLKNRALGIVAVLLGGGVTVLLITEQVAGGVGASGGVFSLLQQEVGGSNPVTEQIFTLLALCWAVGAWVGWWAVREQAGVIACTLPLIVLIADLVNIAPILESAPFWPVTGAIVSGLALLGWTHEQGEIARWARQGTPWAGAQPRRSLSIALGCAVVITLVALIAPPLNRTNISQRFFHSGPQVTKTSATTTIGAISGYSTAVVPGGPIREVRTPILSYRTSAPGGTVYLRGVTLTNFVNGNWYEAPATTVTVKPDGFLPYADSASQGTAATEAARKEVSLQVTYLGTGAQQAPDLLYPGSPLTTPGMRVPYRVSGQTDRGAVLTVNTVTPQGGLASDLPQSQTLTTDGSVSVATAQELEQAGTDYPSWVQPDTSLPADSDFIDANELASDALAMAGTATNPYQIAVNIQNALRADEIYTLQPPTPPADVWPIVYFLNDSHRGYCQYFASAMGAMLRTLGIPSRLVSGFGPGEEGRLPNGQRLITAADAHTWVQVYFPRYGWVNFEPTPDGFYQPTGAAATTTTPTPTTTVTAPHPGVRPAVTQTGSIKQTVRTSHGRQELTWLVLVALVVLLLALLMAGARWVLLVRSPAQLRRRLELPLRLAGRRNPSCLTMTELAAGCAELGGRLAPEVESALSALAEMADRIAFSHPGHSSADSLAQWSKVRGAYPLLVWRGWRAGRRRRPAPSSPTAVRLQRI